MARIQTSRIRSGRTATPALLLVFTDGMDNRSDASVETVRGAIRDLGFTPDNNCYFAVAGIGDAFQGDLRSICEGGLGLYTHADDDIQDAFALFLAAGLAVVRGRESYVVVERNEGELTYSQLERESQRVAGVPLEYMLTIDTSGSMSNSP